MDKVLEDLGAKLVYKGFHLFNRDYVVKLYKNDFNIEQLATEFINNVKEAKKAEVVYHAAIRDEMFNLKTITSIPMENVHFLINNIKLVNDTYYGDVYYTKFYENDVLLNSVIGELGGAGLTVIFHPIILLSHDESTKEDVIYMPLFTYHVKYGNTDFMNDKDKIELN